MQDYNKFMADLYGMQAQFGSYTGPQATLFLFSPKIIPTQVLRPYAYSLTPQFYDDVLNAAPTLQQAVGPAAAGKLPSVATAILPDDTGTVLNTYELSSTWSFVLTIDDSPINHGIRNAARSACTRLIATGYVTGLDKVTAEEPVNPLTQSINPRAVLVFTHATVTYLHGEIGATGGLSKISVSHDTDLINHLTATMNTTDNMLFLGTPGDLLKRVDTSDPNGTAVGSYGPLAITENTFKSGAMNVDGVLKSPKHHLNTVMHTLDVALNHAQDDFVKSSLMPNAATGSPNDVIRDTFISSLPHGNSSFPRQGIDVSRPMTMNQLVMMFPNINIIPHRVPNQSTWDVAPQENMTLKNKMSSMVAATVSSVLPGCGLSDIAFRFNSWMKDDPFNVSTMGVWQFYEPTNTLTPATPEQKIKMINMFKMVLENELFPILKAVHGEFDLTCFCNLTGEILLDLNYLDDSNSAQGGYYETNGRLGGMINPMIMPLNIVNSNATMLSYLADKAAINRYGPSVLDNGSTTLEEEPVYSDPYTPPFQGGNVGGTINYYQL